MKPLLQPVAPSIDDPLELLRACHDKVRRFATLALKLRSHLDGLVHPVSGEHHVDAQAQEAAQSILRYFEMAAPLHHDDEDLNLFPALRALGQSRLTQAIDSLEAEHHSLGHLWQAVTPWLRAVAAGQVHAPPDELATFAHRYIAHAQREEDEVYPAADQLSAQTLTEISAAMVARRTRA